MSLFMSLGYLGTSLFICSLFLILIASKKIIDVLRLIAVENKNNNMMCFVVALVTISSLSCGFYGLRLLPQEGALGLYIMLFLISLLLVCCLQLTSDTLSQLITKANRAERCNSHVVKDTLTGVYNRYYIDGRLDEEVARYKRYSTPLSVLTINVSNYHHYNTIYGFQAGEQLLSAIASSITESIRETDVAARYEADQFIVLLTNTPESSITPVLNRLKRKFDNLKAENVDRTEAYEMLNVKFGKAWCGLSTPSGRVLVSTALDSLQAEKSLLNKQDTSYLVCMDDSKKQRETVT